MASNDLFQRFAALNAEVAATGVARISHGPFPYMALMGELKPAARDAIL